MLVDRAPRHLVDVGSMPLAMLADLRAIVAAEARGSRRAAGLSAPVALLCASRAPYVRAQVAAAAASWGRSLEVFGPDDVALLGEPSHAAARLSAGFAAFVLVGMESATIAEWAAAASVPVVDGGGADGDPAGALADLFLIERAAGSLVGRRLAWIGDSSGLLADLLAVGGAFGLNVGIAHPRGFAPPAELLTRGRDRAAMTGAAVHAGPELEEALVDADAVHVEPFPPLGGGVDDRFRPYALHRHLLRGARPHVIVLHPAPERRGAELSQGLAEEFAPVFVAQHRARIAAFAALLGVATGEMALLSW